MGGITAQTTPGDPPGERRGILSPLRVARRVLAIVAAGMGFRPLRIGRMMLVNLALLVAAPFAFHYGRLARLPDIPEPFDVEKFRHISAAPDDNAFELYRLGATKLIPVPKPLEGPLAQALDEGWDGVTPELLDWLEVNREALELFRQGSEKTEAVYHQPAEADLPADDLSLLKDLRAFARLATIEALRREHAGDVADAWTWYRAVLRTSRHAGLHGSMLHRLVGNSLHASAASSLLRWAALPQTGADELRRAVAELPTIYRMTEPPSTMFKVRYYTVLRLLNDPNSLQNPDEPQIFSNQAGYLLLYPLGEPEMSRRVAKLMWANLLSGCNQPQFPRNWVPGEGILFELQPEKTGPAGSMPPERTLEWYEKTHFKGALLPCSSSLVLEVHHREQARELLLETALAAQLYRIEQGHYPDALDDLVRHGLRAPPLDPFGQGEPIRYRRNSNVDSATGGARTWSIGPDLIDDEGLKNIADDKSRQGDIVMDVVPRRALRE